MSEVISIRHNMTQKQMIRECDFASLGVVRGAERLAYLNFKQFRQIPSVAELRSTERSGQFHCFENASSNENLQTVSAFVTGAKNCSNRASRSSGGVFLRTLPKGIVKLRKPQLRDKSAAKMAIRGHAVRQKSLKMSHFTFKSLDSQPPVFGDSAVTCRFQIGVWAAFEASIVSNGHFPVGLDGTFL